MVCSNRVQVPTGLADATVLQALHDDVLTPDLVEETIAALRGERVRRGECRLEHSARAGTRGGRAAPDREADKAIVLGGQARPLVARLQGLEEQRTRLLEALAWHGGLLLGLHTVCANYPPAPIPAILTRCRKPVQ